MIKNGVCVPTLAVLLRPAILLAFGTQRVELAFVTLDFGVYALGDRTHFSDYFVVRVFHSDVSV